MTKSAICCEKSMTLISDSVAIVLNSDKEGFVKYFATRDIEVGQHAQPYPHSNIDSDGRTDSTRRRSSNVLFYTNYLCYACWSSV